MSAVEDRFKHLVVRERKDVNVFRAVIRENAATVDEMKVRYVLKYLLGEVSFIYWKTF
jgi:hypothetical protein